MKTLRNPLLWITVLVMLTVSAFAQEGITPAPVESPWTFANLIATIGAIVIAARLIVKFTPTPKDDEFLSKIIAALKHIGLHIPLLLLFILPSALLISGCGSIKPHGAIDTTYGADGTVTAATGLDIGTNATVVGSGSYNVATGHWTAGISIVFKDELSAAMAATELSKYNLGPLPYTRSGLEWRIAKFDRKSAAQLTAIEVALKNGATIKGL